MKSGIFKLFIVELVLMVFLCTACNDQQETTKVTYPKSFGFEDRDAWRAVRDNNVDTIDLKNRVASFGYGLSSDYFAMRLAEADRKSHNDLLSPLNMYFALASVYAGAEGSTAEELSHLLDLEGLDKSSFLLASQKMYNRLYVDNELVQLKVANSLWVQDNYEVKALYRNNLATYLYSSSHVVDFMDKDTPKLIGMWLAEATERQLDDVIEINPSPEQVMAVYSTLYFKDEWTDRFNEDMTEEGIFHTGEGKEVTCDFMHRTRNNSFWLDDKASILELTTKGNNVMTLVQLSEGEDLYEWLAEPKNIEKLNDQERPTMANNYGKTELTLPKFDYMTEIDGDRLLQLMGVQEMFTNEADFTGVSDDQPLFVGEMTQKSRISIDEKGIEAASYTEIGYYGAAEPKDTLVMVLNRPFIFAVRGNEGLLYVGVVNDPTLK